MSERRQVLLRIDPAVHDALMRWANDELRSVNAQIEVLLRRALRDAGRMPETDKEVARRTWNGAIEACAMAAWHRGMKEHEPGTMINRRVITGLIADDIRAMKSGD